MYHRQTNKTAIQSQNMISDALFRLMEGRTFHEITVTELCREADVGRRTFYRNFDRKEDVVDLRLDQLYAEHARQMCGKHPDDQLRLHFVFLLEHARQFAVLYTNGFHQETCEKFRKLLPETMPIWSEDPVMQEYCSRYVIAGIETVQRVWVERGFQESVDQVIELVRKIQNGYIGDRTL